MTARRRALRMPSKEASPRVTFAAWGANWRRRLQLAPLYVALFAADRLAGFVRPRAALLARITDDRNDLEAPAIALQPIIADVLAALRRLPACRLARMSGSGATCFALLDSGRAAASAAQMLRIQHPSWWVRATMLAG